MKSEPLGTSISPVEVLDIVQDGFVLRLDGEEVFLSYAEFPWFRDTAAERIRNVQMVHPGHLFWPELDIDLSADSVKHPERFPLVAKH